MKYSLRFGIVFFAILAAGVLVNSWAYLGEAQVVRKELKNFPNRIGTWQQVGSDHLMDDATMKILRASDYVLRDYRSQDGTFANLYVGYYATQKNGASYHSPLNCLPGSGWSMTDARRVPIKGIGGETFLANRYVIQNETERDLLIYWYQGRGRSVASEYWGKVYTVLDSVRLRRSDGAMVRIIVPLTGSEDAALNSALDLASKATAALPEFVPN
ncbi:MAG: exosortase C-terminal domain/associated protein EpsI [Pyrinomonadaceae bacterium]